MEENVIAFVILHFNNIEETINCINSIQTIYMDVKYYIVIVDNASPNGSGGKLFSMYDKERNISVILLEENIGFAKANNLGYLYAKKEWKANFIVVVNNDTIFNDSWKFCNILELYNRTKADIIGPDIVSESGEHYNPLRLLPVDSLKFVRKRIRNRKIFLFYYKLKKKYNMLKRIKILENALEKEERKRVSKIAYKEERTGVVLHGACIIFTPLFIEREEEAFNPKTFMYGEEDLLSQKAKKKGYNILYTPKFSILHIGEKGTKSVYSEDIEREIFMHTNMLKGYQLLLVELKERI